MYQNILEVNTFLLYREKCPLDVDVICKLLCLLLLRSLWHKVAVVASNVAVVASNVAAVASNVAAVAAVWRGKVARRAVFGVVVIEPLRKIASIYVVGSKESQLVSQCVPA
jgi:hypothetical protein